MEVMAGIGDFGGSFLGYIVPFLLVLSVVVFVHELGHFWVARRFGVRIETFSIGFGGEIFGWNDRHGTRWKVSWLPLGGYVKFFGDENAASAPDAERLRAMSPEERQHNFHAKPVFQRMAIVAAGPLANFLLSVVIFALLFMIAGQAITPARVDRVLPDSAAAEAGFAPGDVILAIDGEEIESFTEMQRIVSLSGGESLRFRVRRGGEEVTLVASPVMSEVTDRFGNTHRVGMLGIQHEGTAEEVRFERYGPVEALWRGVEETYFIVARTLDYLWRVIMGIEAADQLGGPLRIAQISGQAAQLGALALVNLAAVLSTSIGLINLFPVPMLDGGHLLYYGLEAARGRPLGQRAQDFGLRIGFTLVVMLMLFATWNDLVHLRVVDFLSNLLS